MRKILFIFGTRPEAIKLAPVIKVFESDSEFDVRICITGQHKEMLNNVLNFFSINPNFNLDVMKKNQSLFFMTSKIIYRLEKVLNKVSPEIVFVQGDTTTAFLGALAGFYNKKKVAHVEAGLRSFNKYSPFPEEINRTLISHIGDYHFAPTQRAKENLLKEGIPKDRIWVVGNTVIDALLMARDIVMRLDAQFYKYFNFLDFSKKIILVTGHRRESFGEPFKNICFALKGKFCKLEEEIKELEEEIKFLNEFKSKVRYKSKYEEIEIYSIENELLKAKIKLSLKNKKISEYDCFFKFMDLYEKDFNKEIFSFKDIEGFIEKAKPDCVNESFIKKTKDETLTALSGIKEIMKGLEFSEVRIRAKTNKKLLAIVSIFFVIMLFIFLAFVVKWWEKNREL